MAIIKDNTPDLRGFYELQPHHIQEVLLVSSLYDSFIFEEDGQLTERIFSEYTELQLHYAPRVTQVETSEKALQLLEERNFDLVIVTLQIEDIDVVKFCEHIKKHYPHTSTVLLTHAPNRLMNQVSPEIVKKSFDAIFSWNGDTKIFLAMMKLIEDRLNASHDTLVANVKIILVVEDSIKNYSSFLPMLYREVMEQTRSLISEGLNKDQKIIRMRTRPKILLATNYEESVKICEDYKEHLLGVITDVRFPHNHIQDPQAGFTLIQKVRQIAPDTPIIIHSSEPEHRWNANREGAAFLDKNSPTMLSELGDFFRTNMGFGSLSLECPTDLS
jgi:CheY-like chemotaxis protein